MSRHILCISAYDNESAACLLTDGKVVVAAREERFTRMRHDARFPVNAVQDCLGEAGVRLRDLRFVAFYDKPLVKLERLLETYLGFSPRGNGKLTPLCEIQFPHSIGPLRSGRRGHEKISTFSAAW